MAITFNWCPLIIQKQLILARVKEQLESQLERAEERSVLGTVYPSPFNCVCVCVCVCHYPSTYLLSVSSIQKFYFRPYCGLYNSMNLIQPLWLIFHKGDGGGDGGGHISL